jgi:hypothetical protein
MEFGKLLNHPVEDSCEYTEYAVANSQQGVVPQVEC